MTKKATYRVVNEPYLIAGLFDWRYVLLASIPAVFVGLAFHSKIAAILAFLFFQWRAYAIYSEDAQLPLIHLKTLGESRHICPFSEEK